jgi:carbon-monoxide dehydrogenase medium subunit
MAKFWDNYHIPTSLDDALELLARYDGRARVVAGGTDLLLDFQDAYHSGERPHYDALIDVTRIQSADAIREENGYIVVGCSVTHAQLLASPLIQSRATALAEACAAVGGPQVRNVATLVGNVAHALPAADGTVALMVLGAEAKVARQKHVLRRVVVARVGARDGVAHPRATKSAMRQMTPFGF